MHVHMYGVFHQMTLELSDVFSYELLFWNY